MGKLGRGLTAEFLKMQRSWLLWLHLLMPFLGITLFLSYYSASGWSEWGKIAGYMEVVSVICPTMAGVICGLASEQEKQAGHMQNLLGLTKSRWRNMSTKIVVLLLCNLFAILLTVVEFGVGFRLGISSVGIPLPAYALLAVLIWVPQIFAYLFHLFLGLRFSKGVTIGVGIVESLVSALLMTGLGEGLWHWIPCGWAGRFTGYFMIVARGTSEGDVLYGEIRWGIICMAVYTVVAAVLFFYWLNRYEGAQVED